MTGKIINVKTSLNIWRFSFSSFILHSLWVCPRSCPVWSVSITLGVM